MIQKQKGTYDIYGIDAKKINPADIPEFVTIGVPSYAMEKDTMEVCYWRKCWNIRDILFVHCDDAKGKDDCGTYSLTIDELEAIRHSLYLTICEGPDAWNDGDQSIWDFEEAMNFLPWDLVRLSALINYMEKNGGRCEAFFYDSY